MPDIQRVCIFCGSNFGRGEVYREATAALGRLLAQSGIEVDYGGTHKGLMGVMADAVLAAGGRVHGVITDRLVARGHLHEGSSCGCTTFSGPGGKSSTRSTPLHERR